MTEPDDRDLERYLKGDSALSRRYREAAGEKTPPGLDAAVLATARAAARRKPAFDRWLMPAALAASALLGLNLAWFLFRAEPVPVESGMAEREAVAQRRADAGAEQKARHDAGELSASQKAAAPPPPAAEERAEGAAPTEADLLLDEALGRSEPSADADAAQAPAPATPAGSVPEFRAREAETTALAGTAAPSSERRKIEMLLEHVRRQHDAAFVRSGVRHTPEQAVAQLRYLLERAGRRVQTAEDFIRLCAAQSSISGEAYEVQFEDGRRLTAEYFLRRRLKEIEQPK